MALTRINRNQKFNHEAPKKHSRKDAKPLRLRKEKLKKNFAVALRLCAFACAFAFWLRP
jgi:hypothetical protein